MSRRLSDLILQEQKSLRKIMACEEGLPCSSILDMQEMNGMLSDCSLDIMTMEGLYHDDHV